jgi:ubiquitin carboxyl-terminal hydrolase L3
MLFPIKKATEDFRAEENDTIEKQGQICSKNVYHMKQTVGNACGTVGILHAIGNARNVRDGESSYINITPKSYLENFFASTNQMSCDEIAGKKAE